MTIQKKILLGLLSLCLFNVQSLCAETIYMKDGRVVEGDVTKQHRLYIMLEQGGEEFRLFRDEIDRIEEGFYSDKLVVDYQKFPDISRDKVNQILRLIQANGFYDGMVKHINDMIDSAPDDQEVELRKKFQISQIVEVLIPIYDQYFSEEELESMVNYYESDVGQKVLKVTPEIMKASLTGLMAVFMKPDIQ